MSAALNLAEQGFETILVEKDNDMGGVSNQLAKTWKDEDIKAHVALLKEKIRQHGPD